VGDQNQHQTVLTNLGNFGLLSKCKIDACEGFSKVKSLSDAHDGKSQI
jgi:hypothetical protein